MAIRGRARRGKREDSFVSSSSRPLAFSRVPFHSFCLLRRPPFREPVDTLDRHLEIITDIHNLLSPFFICAENRMAKVASVSALDLSQIATIVWNHFRCENSHWESIGRRRFKPTRVLSYP